MRKILTILLILPFFSFAQCLEITEEDLIGKFFRSYSEDNLTFDNDGFFRIKGKEKDKGLRWYIVDNILLTYNTENGIPKPPDFSYRLGTTEYPSTLYLSQFEKLLSLLNDENRKEKFYIKYSDLMYGEIIIASIRVRSKKVFDNYSDFF